MNRPNSSLVNQDMYMTKRLLNISILGILGVFLACSSTMAQSNRLSLGIVIPEQDTVEYSFSRSNAPVTPMCA